MQLSTKIGISQPAIARYELDKTEPRISDLLKIAIFFDVTADYLIGLENEDGSRNATIINSFNQNINVKL